MSLQQEQPDDFSHEVVDWFALGVRALRWGDHRNGIVMFSQVLAREPGNVAAHVNRGRCYLLAQEDPAYWDQRKKPAKWLAEEDFDEALRLDPASAAARLERGKILGCVADFRRGCYGVMTHARHLGQADADLSEAIRLDPGCAEAWRSRGVVNYGLGRFEHTVADCTAALHLDPKDIWTYLTRSLAYAALNEIAPAIGDCTDAIARAPDNAFAYCRRGSLYLSQGEYDKALADLTRAIDLGRLLEALDLRACVYRLLGRDEDANADEWESIYHDPQGPCF